MTYTYDAGTTSPTLAGLVEFGGVRLNDGTFKTHHLGGLIDAPDVEGGVAQNPNDSGGQPGPAYYRPRDIALEGWAYTPTSDDVFAAMDQLRGAFALGDGSLSTLVFKQRGWSTRRQVSARVTGRVAFTEPDVTRKKLGARDFSVPMVAPDPLAYDADNLRTSTISAGGSQTVTNAGTAYAPFAAHFAGSGTLTHAGNGKVITYGGGVAVDITTNPVTGRTVVKTSGGANDYVNVTAWTLFYLSPGTSTLQATGSAVTVTWRDAWL